MIRMFLNAYAYRIDEGGNIVHGQEQVAIPTLSVTAEAPTAAEAWSEAKARLDAAAAEHIAKADAPAQQEDSPPA